MENAISDRLNAYIPEVLSVVNDTVHEAIYNFISLSAVSVDFRFVTTEENAETISADIFGRNNLDLCAIFVDNVNRFCLLMDNNQQLLRLYFPEALIPILLNRYPHLIAAAYLNFGHGAVIASSYLAAVDPQARKPVGGTNDGEQ